MAQAGSFDPFEYCTPMVGEEEFIEAPRKKHKPNNQNNLKQRKSFFATEDTLPPMDSAPGLQRLFSQDPDNPFFSDEEKEDNPKFLTRSHSYRHQTTNFEKIKVLGSGEFGCVTLYKHRLDAVKYVLKAKSLLNKSKSGKVSVLRESQVLAYLTECGCCEHIIRYFGCWWDENNNNLMIQLEYCKNGTVKDLWKNNSFQAADSKMLLKQIARALEFCHKHEIVHMDIKPENILVKDKGKYKLGDFGNSVKMKDCLEKHYKIKEELIEGDRRYLALEILQQKYDHLIFGDI
eukprot:UN06955